MAESAKINPRGKGNPNICVSNRRKIYLVNIGNIQCTILYYINKGTNANQSNI